LPPVVFFAAFFVPFFPALPPPFFVDFFAAFFAVPLLPLDLEAPFFVPLPPPLRAPLDFLPPFLVAISFDSFYVV
jgi:hypothetical protein